MTRVIARLDIKNGAVIKGIQLEGQRRIGDPIEIATRYYEDGIDEILLMDSVASLYGRSNLFHTVSDACRKVFVPITMGGGIRSLADVEAALAAGADKVAVNTGLTRRPDLVGEIASVYGSQCLVGSIEAKWTGSGWEAYVSNGREPTGREVRHWARELQERGVGEILVTSVDREGTKRGFDIALCQLVAAEVSVPVIASGGAGSLADIRQLDEAVQVQGIAVASLLHYKLATIEAIKAQLPRSTVRRQQSDRGRPQ